MSENRVQFNAIVSNQLPLYVKEDFPLISEFLEQYYLGQEYQGGPVDLIQNIDKYIKLDETTNLSESVVLNGDLDFDETTIQVDPGESPTGTTGFPDSYGLLQINERNTDKFEVWYEYDMQYINNWTLYLDLKILLKTPISIFRGRSKGL